MIRTATGERVQQMKRLLLLFLLIIADLCL